MKLLSPFIANGDSGFIDRVKDALKDLERCGARCYSLERKVDDLAWFVGGDADKIREVQRLLNATGLVSRLQEDGVYGKETAKAEEHIVDRFRDNLEKFLLNEAAVKYVTDRISLNLGIKASMPSIPLVDAAEKLAKVLFDNRHAIQRLVWKLGAEYYLRPRGYTVAAFMLEHALESLPSDLHFSQTHWVTQKVMQSQSFNEKYDVLERNIKNNPDIYTAPGKLEMDFQKKAGDRDLYLGIGKCAIDYTCARTDSKVVVSFKISDPYNFEELRSFEGDVKQFIVVHKSVGNLANDAGFLSQADGVISPYTTYINFQKIIIL